MPKKSTVDHFCMSVLAELKTFLQSEPRLSDFVRELETLDSSPIQDPQKLSTPPVVKDHLGSALDGLKCTQNLADATRSLAGILRWYEIMQGDAVEPSLARGLVAGQLSGQVGFTNSHGIKSGLFLLAPGIHYPLHQHAARELYFVLSGTLTLKHGRDGEPFHVEPGEFSITPSNRLHALTTSEDPCLIFYAWIGDIEAPIWWWEQDAEGNWLRICWERMPDASWQRSFSEAVTEHVLRDAGERELSPPSD